LENYLAYLDDSYKFEDEAKVEAIQTCQDGRTAVVMNRTIFYPQGGGQPADTGSISSADAQFAVSDVRMVDGTVLHYGNFQQNAFNVGETVKTSISGERRMLNARLHSAGHLIDVAVGNMSLTLKPTKAYHFPDGPYVEYEGNLEGSDTAQLVKMIEAEAQRLVSESQPITVVVTNAKNAEQLCGGELPSYVDRSKLIRVVTIGENPGCPCAGTHLKELKDLGRLAISKIRTKAARVKVSYALS